ncbi:hypothetical protein GGR56DRAFT_210992 [Xylariaceae sp. FL0804]|nr:hypothetical protein GGR56DRAFT_210992 [Xylariaceae sp. FL0804]
MIAIIAISICYYCFYCCCCSQMFVTLLLPMLFTNCCCPHPRRSVYYDSVYRHGCLEKDLVRYSPLGFASRKCSKISWAQLYKESSHPPHAATAK